MNKKVRLTKGEARPFVIILSQERRFTYRCAQWMEWRRMSLMMMMKKRMRRKENNCFGMKQRGDGHREVKEE